ncbi:hypothetical protein BH20ACI4_BH20ACI4_05040 [soil metagenome]
MKNLFRNNSLFLISAIIFIPLFASSCGFVSNAVENVSTFAGLNETGTVITQRAQIRSSFAVVAADLLEVQRGDKLQILEEIDFERVKWYRVRASDEEETEGWIEAQNVILGEVLEKSKNLANEIKDQQAQANGQLRAASNLRMSPEQKDDNILLKLDAASTFEIINWKFVPKAATDAENPSQKSVITTEKNANEPEKLLDKYDVWYQVRLDRSVSPAPAGWLFGRQVELQVPSDIVFYQQNDKKFVTWQRIDEVAEDNLPTKPSDTVKVSAPGSWVILWRTDEVRAIDGVEPDFDGILVLGYDKFNQEHYSVYRNGNIWGRLPMTMQGTGDNKNFTLKLRNFSTGQIEDKNFVLSKSGNRLRVSAPADMANYEKKDRKK